MGETVTVDPVPMRGLAGVPELAGDHLNCQRFLAEHGHELRRSPEMGRWYEWGGASWREDRLDHVQERAAETIDRLREWASEAPDADSFKRRSAHYAASSKAGRRDALLSLAGTDPDIVVSVDQLDAHPYLLACQNGTVDLRTAEMRPADPADLLTHGIAVDFDPDAFSAEWARFIDETFRGDLDLIAYVQRLGGYCLTGVVHEHVLPVATGVGRNGKSTFVGIVQDLLGDLAITAPEGLVIRRHHEPHPERLAVLRGKRLVVSAELEARAVLAEAVVKMLTGGDTLSARHLYGSRFNFAPSHKVLLTTNHKPRITGTDLAIWRRVKVIPFDYVVPECDVDPDLRRRLVAEHGPAVLAWLVQGAMAWHESGLGEAKAVTAATEDYRRSEDTFGAWLAECTIEVDRTVRTKVGALWESWRSWCEHAGERPGRKQDFSAALTDHGLTVETHQGYRLTRGIGLVVRSAEVSSGDFSISDSTGTVRTRPDETSPEELFEPGEDEE